MLEALRNDDLIDKIGGRFKLTRLVQRRWLQLMQGARPMVEPKGMTDLEVVMKEISEGLIEIEIPEESIDDAEEA